MIVSFIVEWQGQLDAFTLLYGRVSWMIDIFIFVWQCQLDN